MIGTKTYHLVQNFFVEIDIFIKFKGVTDNKKVRPIGLKISVGFFFWGLDLESRVRF